MPCDALVTFPDTSSLFHFLRCHVDTATADAPGLTWVWSQIALAAERLATIKDDLKTLNPDFARKERVSRAMATVLAQSRIEGGSVTDPMMRVSLLKERLPAIEAEIDLQIQNEGDSTREMLVRTISLLSTVIVWGCECLSRANCREVLIRGRPIPLWRLCCRQPKVPVRVLLQPRTPAGAGIRVLSRCQQPRNNVLAGMGPPLQAGL